VWWGPDPREHWHHHNGGIDGVRTNLGIFFDHLFGTHRKVGVGEVVLIEAGGTMPWHPLVDQSTAGCGDSGGSGGKVGNAVQAGKKGKGSLLHTLFGGSGSGSVGGGDDDDGGWNPPQSSVAAAVARASTARSSPAPVRAAASHLFPTGTTVRVVQANIATVTTAGVINAANASSFTRLDGGVSGALREACRYVS
jgi:hypothetical protein